MALILVKAGAVHKQGGELSSHHPHHGAEHRGFV
jgi:hypothetical protein